MTNTTCQFCGREIKAKLGTIALHGYRRPGQGWQTGSCWGAKHRPYEVACDQLTIYVASLAKSVEVLRERIAKPITELRLTIAREKRVESHEDREARMRTVTAENFDNLRMEYPIFACINGYSWGACVARYVDKLSAQLRAAEREYAEQAKRLADWKPPAAEEKETA